jgi:tetratricopeptide (TPR) repeat protein
MVKKTAWRASAEGEAVRALADSRSLGSTRSADVDGAGQYASKPAHRAQDLIWDAWEASGARRAALAREALALWPDCADAYVLLAQQTASLDEKRQLLELGLAAGERTLGPRTFTEEVGHFWLIFETRPYMRARAALAAVLWRLGRCDAAVEHQRELLRLNPGDNLGLRYRQANWLLELEAYTGLDELFCVYPDDPAGGFVYTRALAAFRRRGESPEARALLARARSLNPHIPAYLAGRRSLPSRRPEWTRFGEETEATDYAAGAGRLWGSVPGALAWLES